METLATAVMSVFWNALLQRTNQISKRLQPQSIDLCLVVALFNSLVDYVAEDFCAIAPFLCGISNFKAKRDLFPQKNGAL
jgi:hypothetical protein